MEPIDWKTTEFVAPRAQNIDLPSEYRTSDQSEEDDGSIKPPQLILEKEDGSENSKNVHDSTVPSYIPMAKSFVASLNEAAGKINVRNFN